MTVRRLIELLSVMDPEATVVATPPDEEEHVNVRRLIELLSTLDPEATVVASRGGEHRTVEERDVRRANVRALTPDDEELDLPHAVSIDTWD